MQYSTTDQQQALDREYREQWIRTLIAQPKGVLTSGEKIVGTALAWHMNMNANNPWHRAAWMKAGNLAAEVAMTTGSTTNALKSLWEKGWLRRIGRTDNGRGSWVYSFVHPDNVTPFGTQVAADNGVHYPMESTIQWSQVAADNGVRPHWALDGILEGLLEGLLESTPRRRGG